MAETPQRWNQRTKGYEPSCVVNVQTGERLYRWPVDCDEIVHVGGGLWEHAHLLPPDWRPTPPASVAVAEEVTPVEPASNFKRGPGRPRKDKPHEE